MFRHTLPIIIPYSQENSYHRFVLFQAQPISDWNKLNLKKFVLEFLHFIKFCIINNYYCNPEKFTYYRINNNVKILTDLEIAPSYRYDLNYTLQPLIQQLKKTNISKDYLNILYQRYYEMSVIKQLNYYIKSIKQYHQ